MSGDLPVVYLGLGSNLGDRRRNLAVALQRLEPLVRVEAASSLYETEPVGPSGQPRYYNAACRGVTGLPPLGLLRHLREVEHELGRRTGERWGPRPIDIDLLLYGDAVVEERELRVPHSELPGRAFVLVPLAELAAQVRHPELGRTIGSLADEADRSGVRRRAGLGWERS
jgi:2-amino-4-hydroxy-6-hydroxymethyldihydropteridine diphosphokinase